jgi:heme exporter protein C
MRFRNDIYLVLVLAVSVVATYFGLYIAPAEAEMGELVRILYFHLPPAIMTYVTLSLSVVTAILFLIRKDIRYDAFSESAAVLGLIYGGVTLVAGAIWANAVWGVYWNWDPRETTTLVLWLAYIGYFLLRMSVENPERQAIVSAAFNILAFMTVPLSYLSFILWPSLHPRLGSEGGIGLTSSMMQALQLNILSGIILYTWIIRKSYETRLKRDELNRILLEEVQFAS